MSESTSTDVRGRIELICGCMFAGKTARLIERLQAAKQAGRGAMAFKHADDVRYARTDLATHDDRHFQARAVADAESFEREASAAEVVGLDEIHFFTRGLVGACRRLRDAGRTLILVGLDNDMWGQPFPDVARLKRIADVVDIRHVPCTVCGQPARFSQRMTPIVDQNIVGGPEAYESRCAACFEPLDTPAPAYEDS